MTMDKKALNPQYSRFNAFELTILYHTFRAIDDDFEYTVNQYLLLKC
jgi:hypothetical protein